jgi:integrase
MRTSKAPAVEQREAGTVKNVACDAARALEVTLLTGLRTGEVINARWSEVDLKKSSLGDSRLLTTLPQFEVAKRSGTVSSNCGSTRARTVTQVSVPLC